MTDEIIQGISSGKDEDIFKDNDYWQKVACGSTIAPEEELDELVKKIEQDSKQPKLTRRDNNV